MKYVCPCGYEYDPELGDPEAGIAPGTAFEDIPEDWVCPWCGLGKDAFEPAVLSFAHVQAGNTWNIIPEEVRVEGTLRTLNEDLRRTLRRRLGEMADLTARAYGCGAEIRWDIGPGPVMNDPELCCWAESLARKMGFTVAPQANTMGGEDFSEYLRDVPGLFVRVGTGGGYTNHHPKFTADEKALWPAACFFAELAMRRAALPNP